MQTVGEDKFAIECILNENLIVSTRPALRRRLKRYKIKTFGTLPTTFIYINARVRLEKEQIHWMLVPDHVAFERNSKISQ